MFEFKELQPRNSKGFDHSQIQVGDLLRFSFSPDTNQEYALIIEIRDFVRPRAPLPLRKFTFIDGEGKQKICTYFPYNTTILRRK